MKIFDKLASVKMEDTFSVQKTKFLNAINSHPEIFCLGLLSIICLLFFFLGIENYPLMDVDETRYAIMARTMVHTHNWNCLIFNGQPFLEKPPLYFWFVAGSIKLFHSFNPFTVRFPIAILSSVLVFATYFFGKKVISRKFGVISAITLATSALFLLLSHVAILDMVLTVFMTLTLYCGFLTYCCTEKYKKYCWWYFYLFMGMGVLAKGILAIALPLLIMFVFGLITKSLKSFFKPIYLLPGLIFFALISIPWHVIMYQDYGNNFFVQYILVHHFARLMNSEGLGRQRPFWYFIPIFIVGFLPWTFIFCAFIIDAFKKLKTKFKSIEGNFKTKLCSLFEVTNNEQKLVLFCSIYFIIMFVLFSSSSTKLPTYILPAIPAAALLVGYYLWVSDERNEFQESISKATSVLAIILLYSAFIACGVYLFLPENLQYQLSEIRYTTAIAIALIVLLMTLRIKTKRALSIFSSYVLLMLFVITIAVFKVFGFVYHTGENELVNFSAEGVGQNAQIITFDFSVKPSPQILYNDYVDYITDPDFKQLDNYLKYKKGPTFVIIKNKNLLNNGKTYKEEIEKRLKLIEIGEKYSLYVKDVNNEYRSVYDEWECPCNEIDEEFESPQLPKQTKKHSRHHRHQKYN